MAVQFVWKVGVGALRVYKSNIMPLLWQSRHDSRKSNSPVNQQKAGCCKGLESTCLFLSLKRETPRLICSPLGIWNNVLWVVVSHTAEAVTQIMK